MRLATYICVGHNFIQPGGVVDVSISGLGTTRKRIGPRPEVAYA